MYIVSTILPTPPTPNILIGRSYRYSTLTP
jgi:hypothetical protein